MYRYAHARFKLSRVHSILIFPGTLSDLEAVEHDPEIREPDSIYMTVPPSMPRLLDLPLPPSSSPSKDSSLYLSNQESSALPLAPVYPGSRFPTDDTGILASTLPRSRMLIYD